ncbi:unnamed protein product [Periconia digitata]|uniref:Rhodopsin domain-containing protein n=1 Tax=Periconia digitata TaxID=1303443 RepID=A0A9W4UQP1_9PLEO|nr:unnamed protein product [Periconia digitata]
MGQNRQAAALAVTCLFPILAALFVGARIVSRYVGQNFGWDDWLIQLALLLLLGQTVTIYQYIVVSHTGYRAIEVPKQTVAQKVEAAKWSFAVQMFYHPLMGASRASIIMFLFRVKDQRRRIRFSLHFAFWMNIAYTISTSIVNIFQCTPVRYAYLRPEMDITDGNGNVIAAGGKCINSLAFILGSCALSIFMDLIIIPIPTAMVWNLQMPFKTKVAIALVMSMGWIATLTSILRLIIYHHRYTVADRTYNIGIVLSIVEPSVAIIAACAPPLRRLFTFLMPSYFTDDHTSSRTPSSSSPSRYRYRSQRSGGVPRESGVGIRGSGGGKWGGEDEGEEEASGGGGVVGDAKVGKPAESLRLGGEGEGEGETRGQVLRACRSRSVNTGGSEGQRRASEVGFV